MNAAAFKKNFLKVLALFTVVRGYNVAMLMLAMYLTAYFIFANDVGIHKFLEMYKVHFIILASLCSVSAGYIINNYYDLEKDQISRPITTYISRYIGHNFKLTVYLILNALGLIFAALVSWRVVLFFLFYQILVWFYSHKINKIIFVNNLFSTLLAMMPFLALFLYFNNYSAIIFYHAFYLGLLLLITDIIKDLFSYRADLIYNYKTLPVVLGIKKTKWILYGLIFIGLISTFILANKPEVGHMKWYFYVAFVGLIFGAILIYFLNRKWHYRLLNLFFKGLIGLGVISIAWIKINPLELERFF